MKQYLLAARVNESTEPQLIGFVKESDRDKCAKGLIKMGYEVITSADKVNLTKAAKRARRKK